MEKDQYQFREKSQYLNLLILRDELQHLDQVLSQPIEESKDLLTKFRATRSVFLILNNVKDASDRLQLEAPQDFVKKTRELKKKLVFSNHFRNRGIGHLDGILLNRAVQWSPQIFYETAKDNELFRLIESHRAIIESCINSFVDGNGVQKVFGKEIDLMYPPEAREFYSYLSSTVKEAIAWLATAESMTFEKIDHHSNEKVQELAAIAGQTNFKLKETPQFSYSVEEHREVLSTALAELEEHGSDPETVAFLRSKFQI
tara:strand:+ start:3019 stop:3792 length:774 start_codon:yes stop_codon:yes gene_type:complete